MIQVVTIGKMSSSVYWTMSRELQFSSHQIRITLFLPVCSFHPSFAGFARHNRHPDLQNRAAGSSRRYDRSVHQSTVRSPGVHSDDPTRELLLRCVGRPRLRIATSEDAFILLRPVHRVATDQHRRLQRRGAGKRKRMRPCSLSGDLSRKCEHQFSQGLHCGRTRLWRPSAFYRLVLSARQPTERTET